MWQLTCTVNTPIQWRGALTCWSCMAINVHGSYKNMVEGTPHMWAIDVHANSSITRIWWLTIKST